MKTPLPRGHLDLLLLSVLRNGPAHGYGVVSALAERSGGVCAYPEGTVYPALQKLEREGLIGSEWDDAGARRRRLYALTEDGRKAYAARSADWRDFRRAVDALVEWTEPARSPQGKPT